MDNKIVVFSVAFASSMVFLQNCLKNSILLGLFLCSFLILLVFLIIQKKFKILTTVIIAFALSVSWQLIYFNITNTPEWIFGKNVNITAVVSDYSYLNSKDTGIAVKADIDTVNGKKLTRRAHILLYIGDKSASFTPGGKLSLRANLEKPENTSEFPAFTYYKTRFIDIIGFAEDDYTYLEPAKFQLRYIPAVAAHIFKTRIDILFPESQAGLLRALITGDKKELQYGFYEDIRISGLSHTVAVSGMHIAFLSAFIVLIVGKRRSAYFAIPVMIFFALMVGATSSVLRAVIMQVAFFIALINKREKDSLNALMLSLIVILFINPYSISDIGLRLSFAATLGLVLFSGKIKSALLKRFKTKNYYAYKAIAALVSILDATLCATVFTIPVLMTSFQTISIVSPLSNVFVIFLVNLIFMLGICAVLFSFLWFWLGNVIALAVGFICGIFEFFVSVFSEIPFASIYTGNAYIIALMVYLYCLLVIYIIDVKKSIKARHYFSYFGFAVMLTVIVLNLPANDSGGLEVTVLNVGQGQCIAAEYKEYRVFIDCGGNRGRNAGEIAYEFLCRNNTRKADALILTHLHDDHINGCERLLGKAKIKNVYIPEKLRDTDECIKLVDAVDKSSSEINYVSKNDRIVFGKMVIDLYYMSHDDPGNESGIVAIIRLDDFETLVTGDIGSKTEEVLISENELPDIELFIAGHHGSKDSSSVELLNTVLPELTVISVGRNSYGHPSQEALNRFNILKSVIKRTDMHGDVVINSKSFNT